MATVHVDDMLLAGGEVAEPIWKEIQQRLTFGSQLGSHERRSEVFGPTIEARPPLRSAPPWLNIALTMHLTAAIGC